MHKTVRFSIYRDENTRYLTQVRDTMTDGERGCNFSFTPDIAEATEMPPGIASRRLYYVKRALGRDVQVRGDGDVIVRLCVQCGYVTPEGDMLPGDDLCNDCAQEINRRCEASLPVDSFC